MRGEAPGIPKGTTQKNVSIGDFFYDLEYFRILDLIDRLTLKRNFNFYIRKKMRFDCSFFCIEIYIQIDSDEYFKILRTKIFNLRNIKNNEKLMDNICG